MKKRKKVEVNDKEKEIDHQDPESVSTLQPFLNLSSPPPAPPLVHIEPTQHESVIIKEPPGGEEEANNPRPKKKKTTRSPRACVWCRQHKRKCDGNLPCGPCMNSVDGRNCIYQMPKKRGRKTKRDYDGKVAPWYSGTGPITDSVEVAHPFEEVIPRMGENPAREIKPKTGRNALPAFSTIPPLKSAPAPIASETVIQTRWSMPVQPRTDPRSPAPVADPPLPRPERPAWGVSQPFPPTNSPRTYRPPASWNPPPLPDPSGPATTKQHGSPWTPNSNPTPPTAPFWNQYGYLDQHPQPGNDDQTIPVFPDYRREKWNGDPYEQQRAYGVDDRIRWNPYQHGRRKEGQEEHRQSQYSHVRRDVGGYGLPENFDHSDHPEFPDHDGTDSGIRRHIEDIHDRLSHGSGTEPTESEKTLPFLGEVLQKFGEK
eukprot:TRINITY_DN4289_c0_g1_i1.p1 TRINITY_DN4289_c0_g1~~TRINITY_DN4289_c0_g1_i1.p1  ORF type:complete len:428 (-),score=63.45 TRINITY_DN4289_c0_g1_i1:63-1346(-)